VADDDLAQQFPVAVAHAAGQTGWTLEAKKLDGKDALGN
jgi:hypothetical protein